jgi:hypothetical protein
LGEPVRLKDLPTAQGRISPIISCFDHLL